MKTLILSLLIVTSLPCFARLGETLEQSISRYGQPTEQKEEAPGCISAKFLKNGFEINSDFFDGKCVSIIYARPSLPNTPSANGYSRLSPREVDELLNQNCPANQYWSEDLSVNVKGETRWKRDDGGLALWHVENYLAIRSPENIKRSDVVSGYKSIKAEQEAKAATSGL